MAVDPGTKEMVPASQRMGSIRGMFEKHQKQIAMALPRHMSAERMLRIACTSIAKTPDLLSCDPVSLLGAVIQSAQLGLEPDGVLGHAYLVPFGGKAQLIPGYRGLVDLARRSGQLASIQAHAVHQSDVFEFEYGLVQKLRHVPSRDEDPGPMIGVYAVAHLKDGGVQVEVMWKRQVDAIRGRSRAGRSGPWVTDYEEMAKKTVLRRLCKLLPASPELARAVQLDEQHERGEIQDIDVLPPEVKPEQPTNGDGKPAKSRLDQVADQIAEPGRQAAPEEDHPHDGTASGPFPCDTCEKVAPLGLLTERDGKRMCPDCIDKSDWLAKQRAQKEALSAHAKKGKSAAKPTE